MVFVGESHEAFHFSGVALYERPKTASQAEETSQGMNVIWPHKLGYAIDEFLLRRLCEAIKRTTQEDDLVLKVLAFLSINF